MLADDDDAASDASGATNTGRSTVNAFSASGRALRAQQKTLPSQSKKRKGSFVDDVDFETDLKRPRTRSAVDVSTARSVKVKKEDEDERGPLQADPSKRGMSAANARDLPPSLAARSPVINPSTVAPQSVAASATLPNPSFGFSFRSATSPTALSPTQEHGRQQLANERARRAQKDFDADDEDEDDDDHEDGLPDDDAGAPWRSR